MKTSGQVWQASAPSNIALIKYMGKTEKTGNVPTNTSLSYTLPHLLTYVELELKDLRSGLDTWESLTEMDGVRFAKLELSAKGVGKFLAHLQLLKDEYDFKGSFVVRSANDFPSDCGLASSASSFAALTRVALMALSDLTRKALPSVRAQADLSRRGSGSSCRSFFQPWSLWSGEMACGVKDLKYNDLIHQVIVVNEDVKKVSSSDAHKRVTSSLLFGGRPARAEARAETLLSALRSGDWREAFETTWAEFWDMHALFETSQPSFGYLTPGSVEVLRYVRGESWDAFGDGPLITMDAGPNVHLLYRRETVSQGFAESVAGHFSKRFAVLTSVAEPEHS